MKNSQEIVNLSFGQILRHGFRLFSRNYVKLILPFTLFTILSIVISVFILTDLRWYAYTLNPNAITQSNYNLILQSFLLTAILNFLDSLIGAIFTTIAMCSVSNYLYKKFMHIDTKFNEDFKASFNINMVKPLIIIGILVPLGWTLFWMPGILVFVFFIFIIYIYNDKTITNPIHETHKISKNSIIKITAIFLISIGLNGLVNLIYTSLMVIVWPVDAKTLISWYNPATRNFGMILLYELVYTLIEIIFAPLFISLLTPLYANSKAQANLGMKLQYKKKNQHHLKRKKL